MVISVFILLHCLSVDAEQDIPAAEGIALRRAAESGDVKTVNVLLGRLGGLNQRTAHHIENAVQLAAGYGQYEVVCELVQVFYITGVMFLY